METKKPNTTNKLLTVIALLVFAYVRGQVIASGENPDISMANIAKLLTTALEEVDNGD